MKIKFIIILTLVISSQVQANEEISYNWAEIDYHWNDGDIFSLNSSFEITDKFYISAGIEHLINGNKLFTGSKVITEKENSYSLALGFHHSMSEKTDFYSEFGWKHVNHNYFQNIHGASLKIGTRTLLSPKFELSTMFGYQDYSTRNINKGGEEYEVAGLYKFNKHSSLKFGLQAKKREGGGLTLGYRFNW